MRPPIIPNWVLWGFVAFFCALIALVPNPPPKPSQLDRIESTLDETVDFLSDLHAERTVCK